MAMGIVSPKDFERELKQLDEIKETIPVPSQLETIPVIREASIEKMQTTIQPMESKVGRGKGNTEVPSSLRMIIGEEAATNGRANALNIAKDFGISPSSVSAYTKGATSTASIDNPHLEQLKHINDGKVRLGKRAKAKLIMALNAITEDKINGAKLHEVSGVARDMATIMKQMEPSSDGMNMNNSGPTFVFYKPEVKSEDDYPTAHVRE